MINQRNIAEVKFNFIRKIGNAGQNSETYIAHDEQLKADIVIKQINKKKFSSENNFFDEASILYASAHPYVAEILYSCSDEEHIYLAMPYYALGSVATLITGKYTTVRRIVQIGCQILTALQNIHSKGLIHFDVKPDNILLADTNDALLSDFGLAKQINLDGVANQDSLYAKTVPPEAIVSDKFDRTFDIYQFGLTLYRMCCGNDDFYVQLASYGVGKDFSREDFRYDLRNGKFPDRDTYPEHIPVKLRRIIARCLEPDRANRYQSAIEVAHDLAGVDGNTLGWLLAESPDIRRWTKNESGTLLEFSLKADGSTECFKTIGNGPRRRFGKGCTDRMTSRDARTFLGKY